VSLDETAQCEGLEKVMIGDDKERYFQVGTQLPSPQKKGVAKLFKGQLRYFFLECI